MGFATAVETLQAVTNKEIINKSDANNVDDGIKASKAENSNGLEKCPIFVPEYLQETVLTDSYDEDDEEEVATDEMDMAHGHLYGEIPVDAQLNHYQYKYMANEQETTPQHPYQQQHRSQLHGQEHEPHIKNEKYQVKAKSYEQYVGSDTARNGSNNQTDHNLMDATFTKGTEIC